MNPLEVVQKHYAAMGDRIAKARNLIGRPLTLAEKILVSHLKDFTKVPERKKSNVDLFPDRVAMQDATAQMAILQFISSGIPRVQAPSTVHCDHLIRAHTGAYSDLKTAFDENREVYDFLSTASRKYGIGFWKPGSGIIHQVVLENYAFPGGMMIGTDSHTPNAGGLGMAAIGVGGADAVDVMVGEPFGLRWPGVIGVKLTGKMNGWTSAKDVILKLMEILTVKGGTGHIVEYFGSGVKTISCTGKATICNMGAEHGATTSVFPYDAHMAGYLKATGRAEWAEMADAQVAHLQADPEVERDPANYYDRVIEIDLDSLEPYVVGPHSPDKARPISAFAEEIKKEGYPDTLTYALIGSCTNSSYEDMGRSASIVSEAKALGLKMKSPLMVTPGSEQVFATIQRDGQMAVFESVGATVLANACGPCIGQWQRDDIKKGEANSIVTSYNRNFRARNDSNPETLSFITSPELVTALALAGRLSFNPLNDSLINDKGVAVKLPAPRGDELPAKGFDMRAEGYTPPAEDGSKINVAIAPLSERLQVLSPFEKWDGKDFTKMRILLKAQGKCTTDHISPAGPWLKYRGHLDKISDNMFLGATNAFTGFSGKGSNVITGEKDVPFTKIARDYKSRGQAWLVIGDENYGEGSSREHAAMSPRFLYGKVVLVKSFARIHETNLKKQGVLPLIFKNPADYDKFRQDDLVNLYGLAEIQPDKPLKVVTEHSDGTSEEIEVIHTMSDEQIGWFKAGSALNRISAMIAARK